MQKIGVCMERQQEKKENTEKRKATNVSSEIYKAGRQALFMSTHESAFSYLRSNYCSSLKKREACNFFRLGLSTNEDTH
jgi:hypothetical protein